MKPEKSFLSQWMEVSNFMFLMADSSLDCVFYEAEQCCSGKTELFGQKVNVSIRGLPPYVNYQIVNKKVNTTLAVLVNYLDRNILYF